MVLDYPELSMGERDITNHGSGGASERMPNGLLSSGDFTLSLLATPGVAKTILASMNAKTVATAVLTNPIDTMTFAGWYKSVKEESADATSPDSVKMTVVFTPTGQIVIA